jgi:hypothetical protein
MGKPDGDLKGDLTSVDYPMLLTIYETLELVITHCGQAENAQDERTLGLHLMMASRAMRCALELYRDHLEEENKK